MALSALCLSVFSGCKDTASKPAALAEQKEQVAASNPQTATFTIEGMTCAIGCAKTIEDKLAATGGIQEAKVDFDAKLATVHYDADKLTQNDLKKIVESCADGKTYKVSSFKTEEKGS